MVRDRRAMLKDRNTTTEKPVVRGGDHQIFMPIISASIMARVQVTPQIAVNKLILR